MHYPKIVNSFQHLDNSYDEGDGAMRHLVPWPSCIEVRDIVSQCPSRFLHHKEAGLGSYLDAFLSLGDDCLGSQPFGEG